MDKAVTQEIWTPSDETLLQFLINKKADGYRIVSVSPHAKSWYNGYGEQRIKQLGYIVIGEKP